MNTQTEPKTKRKQKTPVYYAKTAQVVTDHEPLDLRETHAYQAERAFVLSVFVEDYDAVHTVGSLTREKANPAMLWEVLKDLVASGLINPGASSANYSRFRTGRPTGDDLQRFAVNSAFDSRGVRTVRAKRGSR